MKKKAKVSDDLDELRDIFNIWPMDTISLIAPNSCISPSDILARKLKIIESLSPIHPIKNKEDARTFDMELSVFVKGIETSAISPVGDKHFPNMTNKKMTEEEKDEYSDLLSQLFDIIPDMEHAFKYDPSSIKSMNSKLSKINHRLNQLNPSVLMRSLMTNAVYQYSNFDGLPLDDIYEKCNGNYRIFSIFLDLKINFANFSAYIYELLGAEYMVQKLYNSLHPRMCLQFYANACVMTCRAIWDKLMGIIVLVELGSKAYGNFLGSNSKKKFFRKHIEDINCREFPKNMLEEFLEVITKLDNTFRTQEAHGSGGKIRNAAFSDGSLTNTVLLEIVGHYNYLHEYLDNKWHDVDFLNEKPNFLEALSD